MLNTKAAEKKLREQLPALQQAAAQLGTVQCRGDEVLHALTLLSAPSWELSLRAGDRQLTGTVANTEHPLTKAMLLLLASRAALSEVGDGGDADV